MAAQHSHLRALKPSAWVLGAFNGPHPSPSARADKSRSVRSCAIKKYRYESEHENF